MKSTGPHWYCSGEAGRSAEGGTQRKTISMEGADRYSEINLEHEAGGGMQLERSLHTGAGDLELRATRGGGRIGGGRRPACTTLCVIAH